MTTITAEEFLKLINANNPTLGNYTVTGNIKLTKLGIKCRLHNMQFEGSFDINTVLFDLTFQNCIFSKLFRIERDDLQTLYQSNITFDDCQLKWITSIKNVSLNNLTIRNSDFSMWLMIENLIGNKVSIGAKAKSIHIIAPRIQELYLIRNDQSGNIGISSLGHEFNSNEKKAFIAVLNLNLYESNSGNISVVDTAIGLIQILGTNSNTGRIKLLHSICDAFSINDFSNDGSMRIENVSAQSKSSSITILNSYLGKTEIVNVDYSKYNSVAVHNSFLENIVFANVKWCKGNIKNIIKMDASDRKELFRQLKNVMIKSNNRPDELRFLSLEMEAYTDEMKYDKGHWADRFILWSSGFSNKHGLSWERAFIIIVGLTILFYTAIKGVVGYRHFNVKYIIPDITNAIEFISPVHKFADVFGVDAQSVSSVAKLLDVVYRVLIGYMLYQFLAAFRKYGKK